MGLVRQIQRKLPVLSLSVLMLLGSFVRGDINTKSPQGDSPVGTEQHSKDFTAGIILGDRRPTVDGLNLGDGIIPGETQFHRTCVRGFSDDTACMNKGEIS